MTLVVSKSFSPSILEPSEALEGIDAHRSTLIESAASGDGPRLRVLVSAYAVSPVRGSEPGLGWNLVSRLARWHDVTVLCSPGCPGPDENLFRDEIAKHDRTNGAIEGLTVHFVEPPPLSRWFQRESRIRRRTVYYLGYKAWQRAAYKEAMELHARRPFDLVHHLNITGYREPGYLWKLPAPFVWGPVGGAADIPDAYMQTMGWQDQLFYKFRNRMNCIQKRSGRRCREAARAARHIWAIGEENREMIGDLWGCPAENLIESGAAPREGVTPRTFDGSRPLRLAWSGQHIGRKALPLLFQALAVLRSDHLKLGPVPPIEVVVLGEGPETERWKAKARQLGVADCVRWTGMLPHAAALREVAESDAMAFTSIQEGTPHAVLESLSLAVPVLCHDACGMGVAVNESCGIKLEMVNPESSVAGFATAIRRLATEPGLVNRLSAGALARAAELSWDNKARHIAERYWSVVEILQTGGARNGASHAQAGGPTP